MKGSLIRGLILTIAFWIAENGDSLHALDASTILVCENSEILGLYKQCQEVTVLATTDAIARVFTKSDKKVLSLPLAQVFKAYRLEKNFKTAGASRIAIPGTFLWNNTPDGFQSLCSASQISTRELLEVSCGRHVNELISRSKVFRVEPYHAIQKSILTH